MFEIGDFVRDKRFNRPLYGKIIAIDIDKQSVVVETDKGNFSIPVNMIEIVQKNKTKPVTI